MSADTHPIFHEPEAMKPTKPMIGAPVRLADMPDAFFDPAVIARAEITEVGTPVTLVEAEADKWVDDRTAAVRRAGRRGNPGDHHESRAEREAREAAEEAQGSVKRTPTFRGRYLGKCAVGPNDLEEADLLV